jgi:hypothetical protein
MNGKTEEEVEQELGSKGHEQRGYYPAIPL